VLYKANLVNGGLSELYHANGGSGGYDSLNQLTGFARGELSDSNGDGVPDTVTTPTSSASWTLDALGNWPSVTTDGTTQTRTSNQQNQLTSVGGSPLSYDGNGNQTGDPNGNTLVYDAWGRLVQVKDGSGNAIASYGYDALGRRTVETVNGTTTDVYFSAQWQALEERVGGQAKVQYTWSPVGTDTLVLRDRDTGGAGLTERLWVQQDVHGDVTALVSGTGQVVERYLYSPYGDVLVRGADWSPLAGSAYGWRYLFQGGRYEGATGLYNFRARDYSPGLGRWLRPDPLGFGGGDTNLYRYVGGNPATYNDPNGQSPVLVGSLVGAGISGLLYAANWIATGQGDWRGLLANIVGGAVGGAVGGLILRAAAASPLLGRWAASGVAGILSGGAQSAVTQFLYTGRVDFGQVWNSAAGGGLIGLALGWIPGLAGLRGGSSGGGGSLAAALVGGGELVPALAVAVDISGLTAMQSALQSALQSLLFARMSINQPGGEPCPGEFRAADEGGGGGQQEPPHNPPSNTPAGEVSPEIARRATGRIGQLASALGRTAREIRDAIHAVKRNLPRGGPIRNPDVRVDPLTGEVYPELPNGQLGDSIGNIFEHLQD
jgi:RHS repeat-associated protein